MFINLEMANIDFSELVFFEEGVQADGLYRAGPSPYQTDECDKRDSALKALKKLRHV